MPRKPEQVDRDMAAAVATEVASQTAAAVRAHQRDLLRSPASRRRRRVARLTWRVGKALARKSYRRRRPLAPFGAGLALYVAGVVFSRSPHGANTVPLVAVLLGVWLWWRGRCRDWRPVEWRYAWAVFGAGLGWLQATAIIGPFRPPMPGILLLLWFAAAAPWWWHHRVRPYVPDYDDRVETWEALVAGQGGVLPGSRLFDIAQVETGWSATIELPPGKLTTASALTATGRIASAYRKPATSVIVEPSLGSEEHLARLLVLTENPLRQVAPFPGPRLDHTTGEFPIGLYADGTTATWRLWTPDSGGCHGLVSGTTGSGKSGFITQLCTEIRHSELAVLWLADPQRGESVPDWQDVDDPSFWFAGTIPEIRRMLQAAERVMDDRQKRRSREQWTDEIGRRRRGRGKFDPTFEVPLLCVVIDEAPRVLADPECRRIIAVIVKEGRKLGVTATLSTQVPSLAELGGDLSIRSMLASTNVLIFRTSDKYSKNMAAPSDLPVNPANLPEKWPDGSLTAGLGYLATASGRVSPLRARKVEDPFGWATRKARVAQLEQAAIKVAGEAFKTWRARRGAGDDEHGEPSHPPATRPRQTVPDDASPAVDQERTTTRAKILDLVTRHGRRITTGAVADAVKAPLSTASQSLKRLEQDGLVKQVRRGIWAPPHYIDEGFDIDAVANVA